MAVRFDSTADRISRTTNIPSTANFTMACWLRVFSAPGSDAAVLCIDNGTNFKRLEIQSGTANIVYFSGGNNTQAVALKLNQWYYVACADDATRGYMYIVDPSTPGVGMFQCASTGPDVPTAISIGGDQEGETANFDIYKPRIWDGVVLTADQVFAESISPSPAHTGNLNSSFDFEVNSDILTDTSGNGRNMTNPGSAGVWQTQTSPTLGLVLQAKNPGLPIRFGLPSMSGGSNTDAANSLGAFDYQLRGGASWFDDVALDPAQFDHDVVPFGAAGVTGTGAATLGNDTGAATGAHGVAGTAAATLRNDTVSASGAHGVAGTAASTLRNDTLSSSGAHGVAGTASSTLRNDTGAATGSEVAGTGAATLRNDTGAATGAHGVAGAAAATLRSDTISSTGAHGVAGAASSTLRNDTGAATGSQVTGTASTQLGGDVGVASGAHGVSGAAAAQLGNDVVSAHGTAGAVHGTAAAVLAGDTCSASGFVGTLSELTIALGDFITHLPLGDGAAMSTVSFGDYSVTRGPLEDGSADGTIVFDDYSVQIDLGDSVP